jgi:biotin carboxyl carrier protein
MLRNMKRTFQFFLEDKPFELIQENEQLNIEGHSVDYKIETLNEHQWLVFYGDKVTEVEVLEQKDKQLQLKVNQKIVNVSVKDEMDQLLERLGMDASMTEVVNEVNAPMPGGILNIMVESGQTVSTGEPLVILEAMKMENIIKSPVDATIAQVMVKKGENVEKGQTLIKFE